MVAIAKKLAESKGGLPFAVFVAMLMGGAVAFVSIAMPTPLFERLVVMSRLPLILPPAEPPLGFTARTLLAVVTGLLAFGVTLAGLRLIGRKPKPRRKPEFVFAPEPEEFAAKTPAERIFREREPEPLLKDKPRLRRADSHPDAPPRRPIFAQEDLGESFDTLGDSLNELRLDPYELPGAAAMEPEPSTPETPVIIDHEPIAKRWDIEQEAESLTPAETPQPAVEPAPAVAAAPKPSTLDVAPADFVASAVPPRAEKAAAKPEPARTDNASIEDLVSRFEAGLARRATRSGRTMRPSATIQSIPTTGAPDDMDDALRDALDQLRRMTSRG
ncbi:hypothetical protein [Flavisphingomonas formosensis]|uniref:hypothetical protein n=1 Tax=Flavisphingomonas formosensis TaxID=861534 RepID=UPI0012F9A9A1|nr:hypothetical protein [Sphingomonas formosensis]